MKVAAERHHTSIRIHNCLDHIAITACQFPQSRRFDWFADEEGQKFSLSHSQIIHVTLAADTRASTTTYVTTAARIKNSSTNCSDRASNTANLILDLRGHE